MKPTRAYIAGLFATALSFLGVWLYIFGVSFDWTAAWGTLVLMMMSAAARRFPVSFTRGSVEIVDIVALVALVTFGPLWTLVAILPTVIYRDSLRTLFVASSEVVMILATGFVLSMFAPPLSQGAVFDASLVYGVMAASVVFYSLDALVNSMLMKVKHGVPITENVREFFVPLIPSDLAAVLAALGTAYVMVTFGPAAALVLFAGAAASLISLHLIRKYQRETDEFREANAGLLGSHIALANGIVEALGRKDGYTAKLAAASSVYAGDVAKEFGMGGEAVAKLKVAALLQDVGMLGTPDEVVAADPEKLNSVGRAAFERHPEEGERILSGAPGFEEAAKWVRWHHERVDGTGYPDRLKGRWLPVEARILAVCESYAAEILDSPHSPALAPKEARMELAALSGKSLDSEAVKVLLRVLDREDESYAAASDERFVFVAPPSGSGGSPSLRVV